LAEVAGTAAADLADGATVTATGWVGEMVLGGALAAGVLVGRGWASVLGSAEFSRFGFKMLLTAPVIPSSRDFFARDDFIFSGAGDSGDATIFFAGFTRGEIFFLAGADSIFVFITANPCVWRRLLCGRRGNLRRELAGCNLNFHFLPVNNFYSNMLASLVE